VEKVYYFQEIDSTNKFAKSLEENNVLILTDHQTHGQGRMGRVWESDKEANLTFTIKRKFDLEFSEIQYINFLTGCVLYEALSKFIAGLTGRILDHELELKWPNDLLLASKKIAGILIENSPNKKSFIIGTGINVNQEKFDRQYESKTTSLKCYLNSNVDPSNLLIGFIFEFDESLALITNKDYETLYNAWKSRCKMIGREFTFTDRINNTYKGKIIDLQSDGGLKVSVENKFRVYYSSDIKIDSLSGQKTQKPSNSLYFI
jgi:BirA family biotin operon repressor/biotin-[acetyl-CoA-carboxylase] ligase